MKFNTRMLLIYLFPPETPFPCFSLSPFFFVKRFQKLDVILEYLSIFFLYASCSAFLYCFIYVSLFLYLCIVFYYLYFSILFSFFFLPSTFSLSTISALHLNLTCQSYIVTFQPFFFSTFLPFFLSILL